jgi:Trk-type K+ transport system membrane component
LGQRWHRWTKRLSLHSKLTLVTSGVLFLVGALAILVLEWANPATFGPLSVGDKLLASVFAGIMPRSGGFNTVDVGAMSQSSWLVQDALMFVGGGSASTAGGIKVTTLAVMLLAIAAEARGDRDIDAFGRRIVRFPEERPIIG